MPKDKVLTDRPAEHVFRVTLNDPETRNASSPGRTELLRDIFSDAMKDSSVRAIILTGAGGNFASGGNVKNFGGRESTEFVATVRIAQETLKSVFCGDKPVIAAVEGYAAGAGVGMATMCDFIVAGESSKFVLPFSRIGMVPDVGLHYTLGFRIGYGRARAALLLGETIGAEEAGRIGLVDKVVADEDVQDQALKIAVQLTRNAPSGMASLKRGFVVASSALHAVLEYEACAMTVAISGHEVREGVAAFLEKRPPVF